MVDGAKASRKVARKLKNQNLKRVVIAQVKGILSRGTVQALQVVKKPQQKKGKGGSGNGGSRNEKDLQILGKDTSGTCSAPSTGKCRSSQL